MKSIFFGFEIFNFICTHRLLKNFAINRDKQRRRCVIRTGICDMGAVRWHFLAVIDQFFTHLYDII